MLEILVIYKNIFLNEYKNQPFFCIFAPKTISLPRTTMDQCRLCPAKSWSNVDFAPQNHRAFVLCPAKCRRLCFLPRKTMEQCRLCPVKSWRLSLKGGLTIFNILTIRSMVVSPYLKMAYQQALLRECGNTSLRKMAQFADTQKIDRIRNTWQRRPPGDLLGLIQNQRGLK